MIFTMIYLKLKAIWNLLGQFLDILTDVFKQTKFFASVIFSLNVSSSDEIYLGFLYRKKSRRKVRWQETFLALSLKNLMDMKWEDKNCTQGGDRTYSY